MAEVLQHRTTPPLGTHITISIFQTVIAHDRTNLSCGHGGILFRGPDQCGHARVRSVSGKLTAGIECDGLGSSLEENVSYIVVAVLSAALIRLAIMWVYPKQANWDE
jgi:hypothetical protein